MGESLEAVDVPYRQNEESIVDLQYNKNSTDKYNGEIEETIDTEEIFEVASFNDEDIDSEASVNPEVPVSGDIDDENTHNTPAYFRTIDIDIKNID